MLEFSLIQAPFRFGVDEGTDPKQVPFGTLTVAQNVVWKKSGRLEKRDGTEIISAVPNIKRLLVRGNELVFTDGDLIYSYGESADTLMGRLPNLGLTWEVAADSHRGVKSADLAYFADGLVVHAWVTGDPSSVTSGGEVYYQITDAETGAKVAPPMRIATGSNATRIRIVANSTTFVILWTSGGNLEAFPGTATSWGPVSTLQTDVNDNTPNGERKMSFDACATDASNFVVAYADDAGGISLVRYNFSLVSQATGTVTGETSAGIDAISIDGAAGESLYILYSNFAGNNVRLALANAGTLVQTVAPATIKSVTSITPGGFGVHRTSSSTAILAYSLVSPTAGQDEVGSLYVATVDNTGSVTAISETTFANLLTRPFTVGGRRYAIIGQWAFISDLRQGNDIDGADTFLVDITENPVRLVGKIDLLIGGRWTLGAVSNAVVTSSSTLIAAAPFQATAEAGLVVRQGIRTVTVSSGSSLPEDMWRSVSIGPETYFAAAVLGAYDGHVATGYGWAHPAYLNWGDTAAATSGGMMDAGNYLYNTVPERRSAAGILHRGPSGIAQTMVVGGTTSSLVNLAIVPVHLSVVPGAIPQQSQFGIIALYRSVRNGEVLQRLTVEPSYAMVENNAASGGQIIYQDTQDDIGIADGTMELSTRPPIYTEGGELDDFQPPALLTINLYRERIFGIAGDRQTVWFSKNHASNPGVAPGFHPEFRLVFNDRLVGLASLDERQFVFSETGIYYFAGDGPAPNGDDADYRTPQKLQTDVGCTNARGLVSTPMGIMFVSGKYPTTEIHILDRGLNVQWVGKRVQDLLDAYPRVTSAVLVADKNQVRFSCQAADGLTGIVIVYDYQENQWSHFVYGDHLPIVDALIYRGRYVFATTSGLIYRETPGSHLDNGSWVTAKIETAWVHAQGPVSYQSIRNFQLDGISASAHGLRISVGFDGNETYQQGPRVFAEGVSGVTSPGLQRAKVSIGTRRKCGSIRFKIEDSAPATLGNGQGAKWSSMGIDVGINTGVRRLPATQAR